MKMSESIGNIAKALAAFQKEVKQPEKNGSNPHFKSKYVTLDGTVKAIHECAPKHGLSYTQMPVATEYGVGVITLIMHESGEFIQMDPFILPMDKKTAQGAGSATTYSRRYSLSAAFGIVSELDDDGNEASILSNPQPQQNEYRNNSNSGKMDEKKAALIQLTFGKNKGKTLKEIYVADKGYLEWLGKQEKTDDSIRQAIQIMFDAVKNKQKTRTQQPPQDVPSGMYDGIEISDADLPFNMNDAD
jgi:hypothetical protein